MGVARGVTGMSENSLACAPPRVARKKRRSPSLREAVVSITRKAELAPCSPDQVKRTMPLHIKRQVKLAAGDRNATNEVRGCDEGS